MLRLTQTSAKGHSGIVTLLAMNPVPAAEPSSVIHQTGLSSITISLVTELHGTSHTLASLESSCHTAFTVRRRCEQYPLHTNGTSSFYFFKMIDLPATDFLEELIVGCGSKIAKSWHRLYSWTEVGMLLPDQWLHKLWVGIRILTQRYLEQTCLHIFIGIHIKQSIKQYQALLKSCVFLADRTRSRMVVPLGKAQRRCHWQNS